MQADPQEVIERALRPLHKINQYPQLLNGVLDEPTRSQVVSEVQRIAADIAQIAEGDETTLLHLIEQLNDLLNTSGIKAALLGRPVTAAEVTNQREMTKSALQAIVAKTKQERYVRQKAPQIINDLRNFEQKIEQALPKKYGTDQSPTNTQ